MRLSRRFRPVNMNGCVLYLPFYAYGANTQVAWDISGQGNHGVITGAVPGSSPMLAGPNLVTNGTFTGDTGWTKGTGWAITTVATKTEGTASDLEQAVGAVVATKYFLKYDLTRTAGTITPQIGGVNGTARSATGTYTDEISATGIGNLKFQANLSFAGTVDNVSVQKITGYESLGWRFDGVDDVVSVANSTSLDGITAATALIWAKIPPALTVAGRIWSINLGVSSWALEIAANYPANGNIAIFTDTLLSWTAAGTVTNNWQLIVAVISGSALDFYSDGAYVTQLATGINTGSGTAVVTFGEPYGISGSQSLKMTAGEVLLFNRAFTATEIKSYYENTRFRYGV